jgi:hypothetical protein
LKVVLTVDISVENRNKFKGVKRNIDRIIRILKKALDVSDIAPEKFVNITYEFKEGEYAHDVKPSL